MTEYFRCEQCGHVFSEDDTASGTTGVELDGLFEKCGACPECGSIEFEDVGICGECGAPVEGKSGEGWLCGRCMPKHTNIDEVYNYSVTERKTSVEINTMLAYLFDAKEIEEMLLKEARERWDDEWQRASFRMKENLEHFVDDAESEFCDFVLNKEDKNAENV